MAFSDLNNRQTIQPENAMNACILLHSSIKNACPQIHKKRLDTLFLAARTVSVHQKTSLSAIGRRLLSAVKTKHCIKRVDRLLANTHLHGERPAVYSAICSLMLSEQINPVILIDWSQINEEAGFHILRASLAVEGRSLTLYEEVYPKSKSHNRQVHIHFLQHLKTLLPEYVKPFLVTDAGFRSHWFKQVSSLGWFWIGRIRNRADFRFSSTEKWQPCAGVHHLASEHPYTLGKIELIKKNPLVCYAHLYKKKLQGRKKKNQGKRVSKRTSSTIYGKREREAWFLVTNISPEELSAEEAVMMYSLRMQIEESFRDHKNQRIGLSLKEARSKNASRLQILLLIVTLATLILWLTGMQAKKENKARNYQANTINNRAVLSAFNLGIQVIRKEGMPLITKRLFRMLLSEIPVFYTRPCGG